MCLKLSLFFTSLLIILDIHKFCLGREKTRGHDFNTEFLTYESHLNRTAKPIYGVRDYVSSQFPALKPVEPTSQTRGKVKDLINFYDNKNKDDVVKPGPSYSSILKGNVGGTGTTTPGRVTKPQWTLTTKPAYSSVLTGRQNFPTSKPAYNSVVSGPNTSEGIGSVPNVNLPSSIANSNLHGNQGNGNRNIVNDNELQNLSEELLAKDTNNAAKYITINYQTKTTSQSTDDKAPQPLLQVSSEAWKIPTIQKFVPLLDNYERDTQLNEYVTPQERTEENEFMDAIMNTILIRHLLKILKERGFVSPDPQQQRAFLKQLWFGLYSRGHGKISSSGFEHVFLSEFKNSGVIGLHNWIYFAREEAANQLNYLGYLKYLQLNDKGAVVKLPLSHRGVHKPVNSMFIGTSPELELALYTLCFMTRSDTDCKIKLAGKSVTIVTHTYRYRSKNYVGSAYPEI